MEQNSMHSKNLALGGWSASCYGYEMKLNEMKNLAPSDHWIGAGWVSKLVCMWL
jgi:hypothetical protein